MNLERGLIMASVALLIGVALLLVAVNQWRLADFGYPHIPLDHRAAALNFIYRFPRMLHWFRGLEPLVSRLPVDVQYQVLCRKV
jgi:hypothetical protein